MDSAAGPSNPNDPSVICPDVARKHLNTESGAIDLSDKLRRLERCVENIEDTFLRNLEFGFGSQGPDEQLEEEEDGRGDTLGLTKSNPNNQNASMTGGGGDGLNGTLDSEGNHSYANNGWEQQQQGGEWEQGGEWNQAEGGEWNQDQAQGGEWNTVQNGEGQWGQGSGGDGGGEQAV